MHILCSVMFSVFNEESNFNSTSGSVCACHVHGAAPGSVPIACGEACGDLFLALQHWRLCISRGSHDHVYGLSSWPRR